MINYHHHPWLPRALPFAVYMLFIGFHDLLGSLLPEHVRMLYLTPLIYTLKITVVGILLIIFWKTYDELGQLRIKFEHALVSVIVGVIVFVAWIYMDWEFATMGAPDAYDPRQLPLSMFYCFVFVRLLGASVIVPIFEELFWRSLIIRYIINPQFQKIPIGAFSWVSFLISAALFGAEHHFWLAGVFAGLLYNLLLYHTRHLYYCIIAHGVTNLALGIYVLKTGAWVFW